MDRVPNNRTETKGLSRKEASSLKKLLKFSEELIKDIKEASSLKKFIKKIEFSEELIKG